MPINIADINQNTQEIYSPRYFDTCFTGVGKSVGLLSQKHNPINLMQSKTTSPYATYNTKGVWTRDSSKVKTLPLSPIPYDLREYNIYEPVPDVNNLFDITSLLTNTVTQFGYKAYLKAELYSVIKEEKEDEQVGKISSSELAYEITLYFIHDTAKANNEFTQLENSTKSGTLISFINAAPSQSMRAQHITSNPKATLYDFVDKTLNHFGAIVGCWDQAVKDQLIAQAVNDFITKIDCYELAVERSKQWQTTIVNDVNLFMYNLLTIKHIVSSAIAYDITQMNAPNPQKLPCLDKKDYLAFISRFGQVLQRLEMYTLPLHLYKEIHDNMNKILPQEIVSILCKKNLNLLLSKTLNDLYNEKANLPTFKPKNKKAMPWLKDYSTEQQRAITTTEPLVLIQAGAGTGKSTTVLARIKYLCEAGVKPEDITVLSFTNAAADHIKELNPNVNSMTIASMIHTIYETNFPTHRLSSLETIANSIGIYYPRHTQNIGNKSVAGEFQDRIFDNIMHRPNAEANLNQFIEDNYDEVIKILDKIEQTSLELEIILCYQNIDKYKEPKSVQSKYIIVDEVQDNSIFEFIYTLKYVNKHKENLCIVGDASQTLYEFRNANSKALNIMEDSGIFTAYKLQTNYRSGQAILDFANVLLGRIHANAFAQIQLQSNSLTPVTSKSFKDAVHFDYLHLNKQGDLPDNFESWFQNAAMPYIDNLRKKKNKEPIAFLSYRRADIYAFKKLLEKYYSGCTIANITSEMTYNNTNFTKYISKFWDDTKFIPSNRIMNDIATDLYAKINYIDKNGTKNLHIVQQNVAKWMAQSTGKINGWYAQYVSKKITKNEFLNFVKEDMLQFEITTNTIKQKLTSAKNQQAKETADLTNSDFIISTIHSAKGLEFPHTIICCKYDSNMGEESKRMYYVGFTRAIKSELVMAFGTIKKPLIQSDYDDIIAKLEKKEKGKVTI